MTKLEKEVLMILAKRLKELASLERANFNGNKEKDEYIKQAIKPYMMWFEGIAYDLEEVVELTDEKGILKKYKLEEIYRLNL